MVRIEPWRADDLALLTRLLGDPAMTRHLGGPETPAKLAERNARYQQAAPGDRMFRIVDVESGEAVGSVGYWPKDWRGTEVGELGWMVVPEFQGRGIAVAATRLAIERARADDRYRLLHAFPNVENEASNAMCRKLGFELVDECDFEYPEGNHMRCNDWRLDLSS
jgi:RimJ/RimL family protein N-acetyltransferase